MTQDSPRWQLVSASVAGKSHEKQALPCQDAHICRATSDRLIVAIADGAGSASLADVGAQLAVKTAVELMADCLSASEGEPDWNAELLKVVGRTKEAIKAEAGDRDVPVRELATTLILGVATPSAIAVAQVGDGAAVVEDGQGNLIALTTPASGEYLNETTFLISPDALETAQVNIWSGTPKYLAMFSDGLQMLALKMPQGTPHAPFFSPLFQFVETIADRAEAEEQLTAFLRSPRVAERTDDDLTLLLAALLPQTENFSRE
ncbi:PP2C family serine/threonine-protein phosphatase [Lyngbya sp. CCY1209]|uniref:PP2C family serine/threonine-protein phosphatase n=1 Tax=Lyngbya sp. CCY1209 TaxID=2886103 RepID=UPI002D216455|nr:PP2C family serine/threonine-protein phosphatase [Lyngbya sp. CCY1209]MEB3884417.1 protein phosphatase 2C domain-containing protein [Lyngbya sp. CCY1209]